MDEKILIRDLLTEEDCKRYGIEKIGDGTTKESVYDVVKGDIKNLLTTNHYPKVHKPNFYELVPTTELEKSIQKILNRKDEVDIVLKRKENNFLFDFDKKMQRFNKIKSKNFRRMRRLERRKRLDAESVMKKDEEGNESKESSDNSEYEDTHNIKRKGGHSGLCKSNPIMSFDCKESSEEDEEIIDKAVGGSDQDEFHLEKTKTVLKDMPHTEEVLLPGWGIWGGKGCEIKRTKANVINKHVEGIKLKDRKDKNISHMIINENQPLMNEKYKIALPQGYSEEDYVKKIGMPVSKEWSSLRIFNKFVKPKFEAINGEVIEQFHFEPTYEE